MSNTEKIKVLVAKIRESLQITPYATMETVNDLLAIVDLKLADAGQGGGSTQVNWDDVQGKPNMGEYAKKTDLLQTITLTGTAQGTGTVEGNACTINTTAGASTAVGYVDYLQQANSRQGVLDDDPVVYDFRSRRYGART